MSHQYFVILKCEAPVLKGGVRKCLWQNFRDFCVIHENHENIRPQKFGAIRYALIYSHVMNLEFA